MSGRRPRVVIVQERLPHYRVPFFEGLRERLEAREIDLVVVHGHSRGAMACRRDEGSLPWAQVVSNRVVSVGGASLVRQPVIRMTRSADLVIVEQASRMVANYPLLVRQARGGPKVAFWGHGANLQSDGSWHNRASEAAKARLSRLPHWWFAYTEGSARRVARFGFDPRRITVVQNAVDTKLIEATEARRDPNRVIYVGSLDPHKRLDLLFATADLLVADRPAFHLVVAGDGQMRRQVESEAAKRPYVRYVGARFGQELAVELKRASAMLIPGAVGLGVIDAFAAGLPVVTAAGTGHGPEFEYLRSGFNSLIAEPTPASLAEATKSSLCPSLREGFESACAETASRFCLSRMVERFARGVDLAITGLGPRP